MASSQDSNINPHSVKGRVVSSEEVAYRDGYAQAQVNEAHARRAAAARLREDATYTRAADEGASSGLLAGLLIAIIALCIGGGAYYLFRGTEPVVNPNAETPTNKETTIIERTVDRSQEVVQPPAVNTPEVNLPEVEVNMPAGDSMAPTPEQPAETAE